MGSPILDYATIREQTNRRIAVEDLRLLARACDACEARDILEIGSADGGSSILLASHAAMRDGRLTCIESAPKRRMVDNMAAYGLADRYTLIHAYSPWLSPDQMRQVPERVDLLFIDGRHEVRWCLADYHFWEPRVRPGGVIVFHDTSGSCREDRVCRGFATTGYVPLVRRAIEIILATDPLVQIDCSDAPNGGAIAYRKGGAR